MSDLVLLFFFALFVNVIAYSKGFYLMEKREGGEAPTLFDLLALFFIYLGTAFFLAPYLNQLLFPSTLKVGFSHLFNTSISLALLLLFPYLTKPHLFKKIWKDDSIKQFGSIPSDLLFGVLTYLIAFPVVLFAGELTEFIVEKLFGPQNYEQVAVTYLKAMFGSYQTILIAGITIIVFGPIIEELLFRGFLQTYLKRYMNQRRAIFLASLLFAFFHFSAIQSVGNISIISSLTAFSLFLGWVYEKRASLFSSIGLHMAFNAVTFIRLFFEG